MVTFELSNTFEAFAFKIEAEYVCPLIVDAVLTISIDVVFVFLLDMIYGGTVCPKDEP